MREFIASTRKAFVAAASAAVIAWLGKHGVSADTTIGEAVPSALAAGVTYALTYIFPNG